MPIDLQLSYTPITDLPEDPKIPVELSLTDHRRFVEQSGLVDLVTQMVIDPFEETLKGEDRKTFQFGGITINRSPSSKTNVSWSKIQENLDQYLTIRADDARAEKTEGVEKVEGLGYCLPATDLIRYIEKLREDNTSESNSIGLSWPKPKLVTPLRNLTIQGNINYAKPNKHTAQIVQDAKRFKSGVEKEVTEKYKRIQKRWLEQQTGFSEKNIPPENVDQEVTPTKIWKRLGNNVYTVANIVRENRTKYGESIKTLVEELNELVRGGTIEGYRCSRTAKGVLVNIKTVQERLGKLYKNNTSANVRYEMFP
jgi:hypothetical protein